MDMVGNAIVDSDIFASLVSPEDLNRDLEQEIFSNMRLLFNRVPYNIFKNEYYVLYEAIKSARKYRVILNYKHFNQILLNNIEKLIHSDSVIIDEFATDTNNLDLVKEEFIKICCDKYEELSKKDLNTSRFPFNLQLYLEVYAEEALKECMIEMYQILTEGKEIKGKFVQGALEADKYYRGKILPLYDLMEESEEKLSSILVSPEGFEDAKERMKLKSNRDAVSYTGIESIDDGIGSFCRGDLLVIQGPPGGGKTKFTMNLCYKAVKNGHNGLYFALEDTPERYLAMFLARHLFEEYNCYISAEDLFNESYDPKYKSLVDEAWYDLFYNEKYGKIEVIPPPLFDEDVEEVLNDKWDNLFNFSWVAIDYTSLIDSRVKDNVTQMLSDLMPKLETLTKSFKGQGFLLILPHQLTTDSIENLIGGKNTTIVGSADSRAVLKSAQTAFTIFTDEDLKLRNKAKLYCTKARHSGGFTSKEIYADLGIGFFQDLPD